MRNLYSCLLLVILFSPCIRIFLIVARKKAKRFLSMADLLLRFESDKNLAF